MALPQCTFVPLSRNRYRCVQTGALVKGRQVRAYRLRRQRSGMKRPERAKPAELLSVSIESWEHYARCPHCRQGTYVGRLSTASCEECGKRFSIRRKSVW